LLVSQSRTHGGNGTLLQYSRKNTPYLDDTSGAMAMPILSLKGGGYSYCVLDVICAGFSMEKTLLMIE